jgi:hypothetical protein
MYAPRRASQRGESSQARFDGTSSIQKKDHIERLNTARSIAAVLDFEGVDMRGTETRYLSAGLIVGILALVIYLVFQPNLTPVVPSQPNTTPQCKVLPENIVLLVGIPRTMNQSAPFKFRNQDGTWLVTTRLALINNSPCPITVEWVSVSLVQVTYADGSSAGVDTAKAMFTTHEPLVPSEARAWDLPFTPVFAKEPTSVTIRLEAKIAELANPVMTGAQTYQIVLGR